jgi:hypothetical protein
LHEIVLIHEDAFAFDTIRMASGIRVMLMALLFCAEVPVTDFAIPAFVFRTAFILVSMGGTILDVLIICGHGVEEPITWVAVRHFGREACSVMASCLDDGRRWFCVVWKVRGRRR